MRNQRGLWQHLKDSFDLAKSLLRDEIETEIDIDTPIGRGFLACQIRKSKKSSNRYLVVRAQGGDATVFVPLDEKAAGQLAQFIQQSFLKREPETRE
jgi:hypothetical protein